MRTSLQSIVFALFLSFCACSVFGDSDREKLDDWDVGVSVVAYSQRSIENLKPIKSAGFDSLQLSIPSTTKPPMSESDRIAWLKKFRAECEECDLDIEYVHVPFSGSCDISQLDDKRREAFLNEVITLLDWNRYLDAEVFVIHPSAEPIPDTQRAERIKNSIASLKRLNAEAKKRDIRLAVENLPRTCLCNTSEETNNIIRESGPDMQLCFDTNHLLKETPEQFLANFKGKIAAIHISDYDYIDEKHWIPYQGKCNWNSILRELIRHDYDGDFMYESSRLKTGKFAGWSTIFETWNRMKREYK